MKTLAVLGAVLVSMQAAFALEPAEAGRQARDDLDALMDKQRHEREAEAAKPEDAAPPPPSAKGGHKRGSEVPKQGAPKAIESRIPTICTGCDAK